MASVAVMDAVDARIASLWTATSYFGLNEEGEAPADLSAFLEVQYPLANAQQMSIGSPGAQVFREEGGIRFVLSIPRGVGTRDWQLKLEALVDGFRAKRFDGVNTWAPTSPVLDDGNARAGYWRLTAVVPYYFDMLG